jgi:murein DD-endopeptidase MepM/ murein hydrolase activator NlpD
MKRGLVIGLLIVIMLASGIAGCSENKKIDSGPGNQSVNLTNKNESNASLPSPNMTIVWPIGCTLGKDCTISNYPDIDENGKSPCGNTNLGHEGTDVIVGWAGMDKGVDVYSAADGIVKWVFDGKYDRCASFGSSSVITNPDCAPPTGEPFPGKSSGYQVCTELGDYCNEKLKSENEPNSKCFWCFSGGNVIVILHPGNPHVFATRYDHLKNGSITVKPGDFVKVGQKIAEVGSAGFSSEPHLHFEVWSDWYTPVDIWTTSCKPPWAIVTA